MNSKPLFLESISEASHHLNTLVTDLLEVARNDAGVLNADIVPLSIVKMFDVVLGEQTVLASKRGINIKDSI